MFNWSMPLYNFTTQDSYYLNQESDVDFQKCLAMHETVKL